MVVFLKKCFFAAKNLLFEILGSFFSKLPKGAPVTDLTEG